MTQARAAALLLALLAAPAGAFAHSGTMSSSEIAVEEGTVTVDFRTRDVDLVFALDAIDTHRDGSLTQKELEAARPALESYLGQKCEVLVDGHPCHGGLLEVRREPSDPELEAVEHLTNVGLRIGFSLPAASRFLVLRFHPYDDNDPIHQHLATLRIRGGLPTELFFQRGAEHLVDISAPPPPWPRRVSGVLGEGVLHILTGWDHLLFLAALILVVERPWALAGVVTGFTAGHTITLGLAALEGVSLPPGLTESAIAFSIAYIGFENTRPAPSRHRWAAAMLFGLVHGFGFAGALRGRLPPDLLVPSLLFFNLGIEAGQLGAVALAWPVLRLARRWAKPLSWGIASLGALLCVFRALLERP